jgi:ferredoxin like protein
MSFKFKTMEDKLGLNKFKAFEKTHLRIKQGADVHKLVEGKLFICPAKVYELNDKGEAIVSFENCLECGTCRVAAPEELEWEYPQGGFGVTFRYG